MRHSLHKVRPLKSKYTVLALCEGKTEAAFINYLKYLYLEPRTVSVKVQPLTGGSLSYMLEEAKKYYPRDFDFAFLVGDCEGKEIPVAASNQAEKDHIVLHISCPCIEGEFLKMLKMDAPATSHRCKHFFRQHLSDQHKVQYLKYQALFSREKLEDLKHKHEWLEKIISYIQPH